MKLVIVFSLAVFSTVVSAAMEEGVTATGESVYCGRDDVAMFKKADPLSATGFALVSKRGADGQLVQCLPADGRQERLTRAEWANCIGLMCE